MDKSKAKGASVFFVLPMRLESKRLPQKMLKSIGKKAPLCVHSARSVQRCLKEWPEAKLVAAVDSELIATALKKALPSLSVQVTDPELPSGTDRCLAAAIAEWGWGLLGRASAVVNVQADMPFIGPQPFVQLRELLMDPKGPWPDWDMATIAEPFVYSSHKPTRAQLAAAQRDFEKIQTVKVVCDGRQRALYFSRWPIPHSRLMPTELGPVADRHVGIYAYKPQALLNFAAQAPVALEKAEGLEQLRALHLAMRVGVLKLPATTKADQRRYSYRGVDSPEDLRWAKRFFDAR